MSHTPSSVLSGATASTSGCALNSIPALAPRRSAINFSRNQCYSNGHRAAQVHCHAAHQRCNAACLGSGLHANLTQINQRSAASRHSGTRKQLRGRSTRVVCRAESKEYYDYKDMPPLPLTVTKIHVPKLGYTVVDKSCEDTRMASLAIFNDIYKDDQYNSRLTRKSAITALCMYDRDDREEAQRSPGTFPNIDLLYRVYNQGLDLEFVVEEFKP